jgi:hypothetical protein
MKMIFLVISMAGLAACNTAKNNGGSTTLAESESSHQGVGLNEYCDPIGTAYAGGTPLFNEATGQSTSKNDYLASKGLNQFCDPVGTAYLGGTPLFNEATGQSISLDDYLASKSLNQFCDAAGTNYAGGTPLFNEATGQQISLDKYLATKFVILN